MIDPRSMTVTDWTDSMTFLLAPLGIPTMKLLDPEEWRVWARNVLNSGAITNNNVPDPDQYENWRDWAMRFNATVELAG